MLQYFFNQNSFSITWQVDSNFVVNVKYVIDFQDYEILTQHTYFVLINTVFVFCRWKLLFNASWQDTYGSFTKKYILAMYVEAYGL